MTIFLIIVLIAGLLIFAFGAFMAIDPLLPTDSFTLTVIFAGIALMAVGLVGLVITADDAHPRPARSPLHVVVTGRADL